MAFLPCVSCRREFRGSTEFTYFQWFNGDQKYSYRVRQCAACASQLRNPLLESADWRRDDGSWEFAEDIKSGAPRVAS